MKAIRGAWKTLTDTLSVVAHYRSYGLYPLLSFIIVLLVTFTVMIPLLGRALGHEDVPTQIFLFCVGYFIYSALHFVTTFFNVALLTGIAGRLEGNNLSLSEGILTALQRMGPIALYTLVSVTLGLVSIVAKRLFNPFFGGIIVPLIGKRLWVRWRQLSPNIPLLMAVPVIALDQPVPDNNIFKRGAGSCPGYDGATFAREGIVTVTLNYRLGVFGFLYIGDRPGSGNFGLLDQIAVLEWVQENISAFGGDPAQVTVAGESAGGFSIGQVLAAPAARGLFNRAIAQSGGTQLHIKAEAASIIGAEVLRRLGVSLQDDDALAEVTSAQLLAVQRAVEPEAFALVARSSVSLDLLSRLFVVFIPTYGTDVLPERALLPIGRGVARDIDLLVGWNADETMAFYPTREAQQGMLKLIEEAADFAFSPARRAGAEVLERYRIGRSRADLADTVVPFVTDMLFGIPSIRLAETAQPHNPHTYMYRFAWKGSLGAAHGLEIPFMFDTLEKGRKVMTMLGAENPPQTLATAMHGAWVNFIKTGSPQHPSLPEWPAYDPSRRATMDLDVESRVVEDPNGDERRLWAGVQY